MRDEAFGARVGRALGSSRTVTLNQLPSGGPLDLLQLRASVAELRRGQTGMVDCRLSVSEASWRELVALAAELRAEGQEVSPGELARLLLERGVDALRQARRTG